MYRNKKVKKEKRNERIHKPGPEKGPPTVVFQPILNSVRVVLLPFQSVDQEFLQEWRLFGRVGRNNKHMLEKVSGKIYA